MTKRNERTEDTTERAEISHAKLTIKTLPLSKLKPHPKNPRQHPVEGSDEWNSLKASLADTYFDPLVWNRRSGLLISGHLRTKVLASMGCKRADVVVLDLSEEDHVRIMLRANVNTGEWAQDQLGELLKGMAEGEQWLAGFDASLLEKLLGQFSIDGVAAPELAAGDRSPFRQCTFTLHDSQFEIVEGALRKAKDMGGEKSDVNENSNGNALSWVCAAFSRNGHG